MEDKLPKFEIPEGFEPEKEDPIFVLGEGLILNETGLKDLASRWKGFSEDKKEKLLKLFPELKNYIKED